MALLLLGVLQALAACSKKQEVSPAPISGERSKAGAMLAYEHVLRIRLPGTEIAGRVAAARQVCETARFGACNVLRIEQAEHDADLAVQIVPEGVEPMAKLASQDGTVGLRQTTRRISRMPSTTTSVSANCLRNMHGTWRSWLRARRSPLPT
jgi:hypothetical protein